MQVGAHMLITVQHAYAIYPCESAAFSETISVHDFYVNTAHRKEDLIYE